MEAFHHINTIVMLQAQYVFIHDALCEVIQCGVTEIQASRLEATVETMAQSLPGQTITGFQEQFQVSSNICSTEDLYLCGNIFVVQSGRNMCSKHMYTSTFTVNTYHMYHSFTSVNTQHGSWLLRLNDKHTTVIGAGES